MTELTNKLGLGQRKHNELMEDFSLQTPLENSLYNRELKSFELLFNACCTKGNAHFVYQVIMRNFDIIITFRELDSVTESLYQDDPELGNTVTFGMRLTQK